MVVVVDSVFDVVVDVVGFLFFLWVVVVGWLVAVLENKNKCKGLDVWQCWLPPCQN